MTKKNKNTNKTKRTNKSTANIAPQQQRTIENMSSEELALLLGEQYKMVMQSQNNIAAISDVLEQRKQALAKKAIDDGKQRD